LDAKVNNGRIPIGRLALKDVDALVSKASFNEIDSIKKMAPNEVGEGEEDALIYRESRVAAAESKKTSAASTHHGTPTRKRSPANNQGEKPSPNPQRKGGSKGTKRESSLEDDQPRKKVAKKKYGRCECSADGCTNIVYSGGVCFRHGAKAKRCSREECTASVQEARGKTKCQTLQ
jgi:hypothetical protein